MPRSTGSPRRRSSAPREVENTTSTAGRVLGFLLAAVSLLALIGLLSPDGIVAGALGKAFATLFGRPAWLAVIAFIGIGVASLASAWGSRRLLGGTSVLFAVIFLASLSGVIHLASGQGPAASGPNGGGLLGRAVGWNVALALGRPGAYVALTIIMLGGLVAATRPPSSLRYVGYLGRLVIAALGASTRAGIAALKRLEERSSPLTPRRSKPPPKPHRVEAQAEEKRWEQAPLIKVKTSLAPRPSPEGAPADAGPKKGRWSLPTVDLLSGPDRPERVPESEIAENAATIEATLASFDVEAKVIEAVPGPVVTQYCLRPGQGVKVSRISALSSDLALALSAKSIRIEAPVPGRPFVGLELPNRVPATVTVREVIESAEFAKLRTPLKVLLGKDVADESKIDSLTTMPHLLIAGSTGSGKSVFLNSLMVSLVFQHSPDELKLILIDPKMVELVNYNQIPHLQMPVVTEPEQVVSVLAWASQEMTRRFRLLAEAGHRNIQSLNKAAEEEGGERLPYLVIIIDELADLMMTAPAEVERYVCRLAQMARAIGIHLVISTQRPSVDVVTGLIKANFPTRVAFMVSSQVDSRTILDSAGAERLVGRGDMLFAASDSGKLVRIQGAFASDEEISRVVEFWAVQGSAKMVTAEEIAAAAEAAGESDSELYTDALELVRRYRFASAALLQRELQVGFRKAQKLIETLESQGIVGPAQEGRPSREVLAEPTPVAADE